MKFDELKDPVLQEKLRNAKNPEDILSLAREEGLEISDEQIQAVAGGMQWRCTDQSCGEYFPCPADMPVKTAAERGNACVI